MIGGWKRLCLAVAAISTSNLALRAQHSEGLAPFKIVFDSDVRVLAMGDSFASWTSQPIRIFPAVLYTWPIQNWTGIAGSTHPAYSHFAVSIPRAGGPANGPRQVDFLTSYRVESKYSNPRVYFGLPIRPMQEFYLSPTIELGPENEFLENRIANSSFEFGANGRFTHAGDELRYRLTYYATRDPNDQYAPLVLRDHDNVNNELSVDLVLRSRKLWHRGEIPDGLGAIVRSGQINATTPDLPVKLRMDANPRVLVVDGGDAASPSSEGCYFIPASHVFYHVDPATGIRKPGLYYSALADSSWAYAGFGANAPSVASKQFTEQNLTHWLDVTTLDRDQPLRVFYCFAVEAIPMPTALEHMRAMVRQTRSAALAVGISDVQQCIVIPPLHLIGPNTLGFVHAKFQEQRDAALEVAMSEPGTAVASLYDATDQILFDGSQEARDWLVANGYETFTYGQITIDLAGPSGLNGELLDAGRLHPRNAGAAVFFAHLLGKLIEESDECYADCEQATGSGRLDIFDLLCFQDAFFRGEPYACDCDTTATGPGVCDIFDFLCFQDAFARGCP